jgi:hypothetical protein
MPFQREIKQQALELLTNNTYLAKISDNELPNNQLAVHDFLGQYRFFNQKFRSFLNNISGLLKEEHQGILFENIDEEMGIYDSEFMAAVTKIGIDTSTIHNVPHSELYSRALAVLKVKESKPIPEVTALIGTMERLSKKSAIAGLTALIYGSEYIVPTMYNKLYSGILKV